MMRASFSAAVREGKTAISAHPLAMGSIALAMVILSSADLMEVIPFFAPVVASAPFPFFYETHDIVALAVVMLTAHRWGAVVGIGAGLLFFGAHIPIFILRFPEELPDLARLLFIGLVSLGGAYLIAELRRAQQLVERRLGEIKATAELNMKVLNERIQLLEEASRTEERLARLHRLIALASRTESPLQMAQEFLRLVQAETGAEYASLTLVNPDGTLGERADSFRGIAPFPVASRPGGLGEHIRKTGQSQYISDTSSDPRANLALIQAGIRSYLGIPLKVDTQLAGILFIHSTQPNAFQGQQEFFESIALLCALPLKKAILFARVEKAKQEWEMLVDTISDGMVMIDRERKIIRANEAFARLVGKPVQEVIGEKICRLLHGREEPISTYPLEQAIASGNPQSVQWREPYLDNRLLDIRILPVPTPSGEPAYFLHIFVGSAESQ